MPTSSSGGPLVASRQYTRVDKPFVDIHRFAFVHSDAALDVREATSRENGRITKITKGSLATPLFQPLEPSPSFLVSNSPDISPRPNVTLDLITFRQTIPGLTAASSMPVAPTPPQSSSSQRTNHRFALTTTTTTVNKSTLAPIFDLKGKLMWVKGRSMGLENCDDSAAVPLAPLPEDLADIFVEQMSAKPLSGRQSPTNSERRVGSPQVLKQHGITAESQIHQENRHPGHVATATTPQQQRSVSFHEFAPLIASSPRRPAVIPGSQHLVVGAQYQGGNSGKSASLLTTPRRSELVAELSTAPSGSYPPQPPSLSHSRRGSMVRSKNARLARQLEKQSHDLHERIVALDAADQIHRDDLTRLGSRVLAQLGYVNEMHDFMEMEAPLPKATQYLNLHSLDQIAEVRVAVTGEGAAVEDDEKVREANAEVRWMTLLKKDVSSALQEEEAARLHSHTIRREQQQNGIIAPPPSTTRKHPQHSGSHSPSSLEQSPSRHSRLHAPLERFAIDETHIARLSDKKISEENKGARQAPIRSIGQTADDDLLEALSEHKDKTLKEHAGVPPVFGDKANRKRHALQDTTALSRRLSALSRGSTFADVQAFGAPTVVDMTLYQKDAKLFSLTGEDTDPPLFPNFPFSKEELLRPRKEGYGISLTDSKNIAEDKAFTERYAIRSVGDKLERTHIVRRMVNKVFSANMAQVEKDEDEVEAINDWRRWKEAAGTVTTNLEGEELKERVRKDQDYSWLTKAKERGVPLMQRKQ